MIYIIIQLAVYTTYIYCQLVSDYIYHRSHLLREPGFTPLIHQAMEWRLLAESSVQEFGVPTRPWELVGDQTFLRQITVGKVIGLDRFFKKEAKQLDN